jgi:hypothetical protein
MMSIDRYISTFSPLQFKMLVYSKAETDINSNHVLYLSKEVIYPIYAITESIDYYTISSENWSKNWCKKGKEE